MYVGTHAIRNFAKENDRQILENKIRLSNEIETNKIKLTKLQYAIDERN